jgi:ankyrin repeat protein
MNELHKAAMVGDLDGVRRALTSGVSIDSIEKKHGNTALMLAAYNNQPSVVEWLLASGATVDARCHDNNTALMKAAWSGATACVDRLVAGGADVNAVEKNAMTPLMFAAFHGRLDVVKALVRAGADVRRTDSDGYTALRNAQERGHVEIVAFLRGLPDSSQLPGSAAENVPIAEAAMNFDLGDVNPFLESVSRRIEKGFSVDVARDLASQIAILAIDDERSWTYEVVFNGTEMMFTVTAFMDDVDSPDLAMFAPPGLIAVFEVEMKAYFR